MQHAHNYIRHGTTDRFAVPDIKVGTVIGEMHRRLEFRHFLATIEQATLPEV
ncbi:hypothetical protein [Azomonas macrocytogenes]|uniref:Uncharacterized protein n=1 Tax=Azomonas macrocytogenes TaxID=69962 RepID=A0A839TAG6_AZOMA|nr:hypothetical protein [Azomonas macrocytogenes]MBB3105144.1 hypothetical protein [Azomonas macrocytogenes]